MDASDTFANNLDAYLSQAERLVNYADYLLGSHTGPWRILIGRVMMVAFSVLAAGRLFLYAWESEKNIDHLKWARQYGGYVVHGGLNVLRGMVAAHTLSGGIFLLLAYDLSHHRFHYYFEKVREGEHTVNRYHPDYPV